MTLLLDDLDLLSTPLTVPAGTPLHLPIDAIDEDPDQPRQDFDPDSLAELAETIRERGVRQPISVRRHPQQPDRWMLNFGARRLRASKLAGKEEIPAFVDDTADSYDQVIENEQRAGLTPLELALFVQRRLAAGDIQAEIARRLSKSRQYVSMASALIDAPDWLMGAYREGRCRGLNELFELRKLAREHPQHVEAWTAANDAITRDRVTALRGELCARRAGDSPAGAGHYSVTAQPDAASDPRLTSAPAPARLPDAAPPRNAPRPQLLATLDGASVVIDTQSIPAQVGCLFVRVAGALDAEVVQAERLKLTGLFAG